MAELPEPGSTFAEKYVIESELGRGAAGVVFSAMHTGLGQLVAIKVLRNAGSTAAARMMREARAALALQSEHVVRVMDVGSAGDHVFLVMEKLEGVDLGTLLKKRGRLPIAEAVDLVLQACAGVAEAHAAGVVHRDLKPGNLFLTRRADGSALVKVLDFGISKVALAEDGEASLTGPAETLGSPMYMAPEQVRGAHDADHRADMWSLGVILFRLVTGKGPFGTPRSVSAALASVVADEPSRLRDLLPDAPAELEAIVLGCMTRSPGDRIASVSELAARLAPFGTAEGREAVARLVRGRPAAEPARRPRAKVAWLVAVVVAILLVPAIVLGLRHRGPPAVAAAPSATAAASLSVAVAPSAAATDVPVVASAPTLVASSPRPSAPRPAPRPRPSPGGSVVRSAATDDRY